jgi:hypothetical protein
VVEFRPHRYMHFYPITLYHVERFAWEQALFSAETATVLGDRERAPAWEIGPAGASRIAATGLSWRTGEALAAWLGGRLPGRAEWLLARTLWAGRPALGSPAGPGAHVGVPGCDARVRTLAARLLAAGPPRGGLLPERYGDLVSEFSEAPLGDRWVLRQLDGPTRLDAERGVAVPIEGAGASVVFDECEVVPIDTRTGPTGRGAR